MHSRLNARSLLLLILALLPAVAMSGQCDQIIIGPGGQVCTAQAVPSVVLSITDIDGNTVPVATTIFSIDGGFSFIGGCTGTCNSVILSFEAVGEFDIEVSSPGFLPSNRSVVVEVDEAGCHPVTEEVAVALERDETVGALHGAWYTLNLYGASALRFGQEGEIIGAILYDRTIGGDGNFYIAYNGHQIRGAPGQQIISDNAPNPTRGGDIFDFRATTASMPVGFEGASISADYNTLTGMLEGVPATYSRMLETPEPLQDP
jgi:hypothetical protein